MPEQRRRRFQGTATLRVSPEAAHRMEDLYDASVLKAVAESAGGPDESGWTRIVLPIEGRGHALGEVFKLGWGVEVLEPDWLCRAVAETARGIARLHE